MRESPALYAFNRGLVSPLGLARTDQKRVALSAEVMENWIPRVLGSMSLRPGLQYIGATASNAKARMISFIFATNDTALVEFTNSAMRVWIDDALLTRVAVSTTITNGTFNGNITGWTDGSDAGASVAWEAGNYMKLLGTGTARAIGYQALTVSASDQGKEHGIKVVIARGPVTFKIGTSLGDDSLVAETMLDTGTFSFGVTPDSGTATIYVQFSSTAAYKCQVQSCTIEPAGVVSISSPYLLADLDHIREDQSADTVFLACAGYQQRKIERRGARPGARSWGLSHYVVDDGPFLVQNFTPTTITASALVGDITLTASRALFNMDQVGGLFQLTTNPDVVSQSISAQNTFTSSLKVTGSGIGRSITVTIAGTWVALVKLMVSTDNSTFTAVPGEVWNGNVTGPYLDGLDGQTRYYKLGVATGDYTSGTVQASLGFTSGTLDGIVRITGFTSNLVVTARVLSDIGTTSATAIWREGSWSDLRGFPTSVLLQEGRLWWAGQNGLFGTISDSYFSMDEDVTGDSGPINRTIGSGPVDTINWIMGLQRIILGAQGAEFAVKSSAFDTPLTPTDFTIKQASTQGSGAVDCIKIDQRGVFVDRTSIKVFEVVFDIQTYEYSSNDITAIVPELGSPGIVRMDVQRKPDTRIHCVRSDGTVMVSVADKIEDVLCWIEVTSDGADGLIEDVVVLPAEVGSTEDQVYYVVKRSVNGATVRYLEKWAKETECRGTSSADTALNKQADSFVVYDGSPATVLSVPHLIGEDVVVWADGVDLSPGAPGSQTTYTVGGGGTITVASPVENAVIGLPYTAQWQSAKLGIQASLALSPLNERKRINHLGLVGAWLHPKGIQFGPDFDNMNDLPEIENGTTVPPNTIRISYDQDPIVFPGVWDPDARLCIQAQAPRPATILAMVPDFVVSG